MMRLGMATIGAALLAIAATPMAARAQSGEPCRNTGSFATWKREFRAEIAKAGVSERTIRRVYDPVEFDEAIIRRDRRQSIFALTFAEFSKRLVSAGRLKAGQRKLAEDAELFAKAKARYGVPGEVITAFWALESDFGAGITKQYPILNSLATLAYDCRRSEMFRAELVAALKLVDTNRIPLEHMIGSWAGEIGETQFLPGHVLNHGVDADNDGEVDLNDSDADIVFSTAAYIKHLGWRAGEPWLQEVRVPGDMPWAEADLAILHPVAKWASWGVRDRDGKPLNPKSPDASLLLPMGRNGPAFLAFRNFQIYPQWNESLNYSLTAAYFATRLAGAPKYRDGNGSVEPFGMEENKAVQQLLSQRGYDVGGVDGMLGAKSRAAIKAAQIKFGLPADSYPSADLVERLRRGR